jgi:hypothetical protein
VFILVIAASLFGAAVQPAPALADVYPIYLCSDGFGTSALQAGWSSTAGNDLTTAANCKQPLGDTKAQEIGDGLQVWSVNQANGTMTGAYWLRAPAGTSITGLSFSGAFSSYGGWVAHWATSMNGGGDPTTDCGTTQGCVYDFPWPASFAVNNANMIGFGLWCHASTCAKDSSQSMFGPAGSANVFDAVVSINDPQPPALSVYGTAYTKNTTGWISDRNASEGSPWSVYASASDPGGVCDLNVEIGSLSASSDATPNYGSSTATPCPTSPTAVLNLNPCQSGGLPAGKYTSSASAMNPANMTSYATGGQIQVECSGPQVNVTSTENLTNWYTGTHYVEVDAGDESGIQGDVTCTVGPAGSQQTVAISSSQLPYSLPVTQNGANDVSCTAENNVNYTTTARLSGQVLIDNQAPTVSFSGPSPAPAWVSGSQTITVTGSEQQSLSGIESVSCQLDGSAGWTTTQGATAKVQVNGDGQHTLRCYTTTGAGIKSAVESYAIQIDSTPPAVSFSNGPSQTAWSTTAQTIDVTATKPAGSSGVDEISCTLNQQASVYGNAGEPQSQTVEITVQPPGGVLTCRALDHAGNWSGMQAWSFLIDDSPPTGVFLAPDPLHPARVSVRLEDTESGVAGARIELQTASSWQQLPTTLNGNLASATIADDGSIPDGTYDIQALVWDKAGNEATITQGSNGTPESITLPLRIVTQLHLGPVQPNATGANSARVHARRQAGARSCARECAKRAAVVSPELRFGQTASVRGQLETIDGTPIPNQSIAISQQASGWASQPRGALTTDALGRFTYAVTAGASRLITFSYSGTDVLRGASAVAGVRVAGKGTIAVARSVVAGGSLRIRGRILGGYVPTAGVLVQLQYRVKSVPVGWAPFERPIFTDPTGRWTITFPVAPGARGYTYLFRALIPRQTGWPFLTTSSNVVARHVR